MDRSAFARPAQFVGGTAASGGLLLVAVLTTASGSIALGQTRGRPDAPARERLTGPNSVDSNSYWWLFLNNQRFRDPYYPRSSPSPYRAPSDAGGGLETARGQRSEERADPEANARPASDRTGARQSEKARDAGRRADRDGRTTGDSDTGRRPDFDTGRIADFDSDRRAGKLDPNRFGTRYGSDLFPTDRGATDFNTRRDDSGLDRQRGLRGSVRLAAGREGFGPSRQGAAMFDAGLRGGIGQSSLNPGTLGGPGLSRGVFGGSAGRFGGVGRFGAGGSGMGGTDFGRSGIAVNRGFGGGF